MLLVKCFYDYFSLDQKIHINLYFRKTLHIMSLSKQAITPLEKPLWTWLLIIINFKLCNIHKRNFLLVLLNSSILYLHSRNQTRQVKNTESYLPTYKSMTIKPKSFSLLPMSKLQFLDHRGFHAPRCLFYTFISFFEHYPPSLFPIYNYAFYL